MGGGEDGGGDEEKKERKKEECVGDQREQVTKPVALQHNLTATAQLTFIHLLFRLVLSLLC